MSKKVRVVNRSTRSAQTVAASLRLRGAKMSISGVEDDEPLPGHWTISEDRKKQIDALCGVPHSESDPPDPSSRPSEFLPLWLSHSQKATDTFIKAARQIVKQLEDNPQSIDSLDWMIQNQHAAPPDRAHTYLFQDPSKKISVPTSPRNRREVDTSMDGWVQVSQQSNGVFTPFEDDAPLEPGCVGMLASTINAQQRKYKDGRLHSDPKIGLGSYKPLCACTAVM